MSNELESLDGEAAVEAAASDESGTPADEGSITAIVEEQDAEAERFAMEFLAKIIRLRGVRVEREAFLRQELHKRGFSQERIAEALATTPLQAGATLAQLDEIASAAVDFEARKSAAFSFASGIPGGLAMFAAVPADLTQYYVHAFRVMQKLTYVYGWQDLLGDLDETDDETVGKVAVFLGVMMGVGGAAQSFAAFAQQVARPAIQKQITQKALTKTAWYPLVKQTLKLIGVKVTKDSFAKTVTKVVPVAGGAISGGMTLVALGSQGRTLQRHLRELPPPGVDGEEYATLLAANTVPEEPGALANATEAVRGAAQGVASGTRDAATASARRAKDAGSRVLGAVPRLRPRRKGAEDAVEDPEADTE